MLKGALRAGTLQGSDSALSALRTACARLQAALGSPSPAHPARGFSSQPAPAAQDTIAVSFFDEKDGTEKTVQVPIGQSLLEAAHENEIDLEGACEGSLACSTCHVVVVDPVLFDKIPEPEDDENDMLDLAYGLTETSRLGCQILAAKELDGMKVRIPSATRNFAVDGYRPKPH